VDTFGTSRLKPMCGGIICSIRQIPHQLLPATQISLLMASIPPQTFGEIDISCPSVLCLTWSINICAQSNSENTKYFIEIGVMVWLRPKKKKKRNNTAKQKTQFSQSRPLLSVPHIPPSHSTGGGECASTQYWMTGKAIPKMENPLQLFSKDHVSTAEKHSFM